MGINREPCPKSVFPQQGDRLGIAWGSPLTSVGVSQSPFLAFPSLLPVAVEVGREWGKVRIWEGFFFNLFIYWDFVFWYLALLEWEGPRPLCPTGPLFPKPCSSPIPTYLSTCIKPPGLGMGVKGERADTWRFLTHNHPDQP